MNNNATKLSNIMDDNEKMKLIVDEWLHSDVPDYVERNVLDIELQEGIAYGIVGVRRAGKTFTLFEIADKLRKKLPHEKIIYVNFEDQRLQPLKGKEIIELPSIIFQNYNVRPPLILLLDEIQAVPDWERGLRTLLDKRIAKIIFTGSSSKLTPRELPPLLAGRTLTKIIYPLSFVEFLKFKGFNLDYEYMRFSGHDELLRLFKEYLLFGGFPQIVLSKNKRELLTDLFYTIFYRDLISKFEIHNIQEFEAFIRLLIANAGTLFSASKSANFLKSIGIKITKTTLLKYLEYAKSAFLVFPVEIFSYKIKDRLQYPKKIYIVDTGFLSLSMFKLKIDWGMLFENAVFMELIRRNYNVFYWKNERGEEVDFVLVENLQPLKLLQACWDVKNENTLKREIRALKKASKELKVKECEIITFDFKGEKVVDDLKIKFIPFWEWAWRDSNPHGLSPPGF